MQMQESWHIDDTTALDNNYAVNDEDFRTVVCGEFENQGWNVIPV
jgi:hypothetical protein